MNLAFLGAHRSLGGLARCLEGVAPGETLLVCADEWTRHLCDKLGFDAALILERDLGLRPDRPALDLCFRLAGSWYKDDGGRDFTQFRGISLGGALEGHLWSLSLLPAVKFLNGARHLMESRRPETVYRDPALPPRRWSMVESLCTPKGIAPKPLHGGPRTSPSEALSALTGTNWPMAEHAWARSLLNALKARPPRGPRVLISHCPNFEPLLDAMARSRDLVPVFYGSPGRRLTRLNEWARWSFLTPPRGTKLSTADRARLTEIGTAWETLAASPTYRSRFVLEGVSFWEQAWDILQGVIQKDFAFTARQTVILQAALDASPVDLVVVPFDLHTPERLLLLEARRRGIPSTLIPHGLPGLADPLVDTQADYLLVGGPGQAALYSRKGISAERILETGHPMMDRAETRTGTRDPGAPRILLLSNMAPVKDYILVAVDVLKGFPGIQVTIKLHPGDSEELFREALGGRLDERFRMIQKAALPKLLKEADLVIGPFSTAMIEAMAMGKPVLAVNLERAINVPPFDGKSGMRVYESKAELTDALERFLAAPPSPPIDHSRVLDAHAGPRDGRNCERVLSVLRGLIRQRLPRRSPGLSAAAKRSSAESGTA